MLSSVDQAYLKHENTVNYLDSFSWNYQNPINLLEQKKCKRRDIHSPSLLKGKLKMKSSSLIKHDISYVYKWRGKCNYRSLDGYSGLHLADSDG